MSYPWAVSRAALALAALVVFALWCLAACDSSGQSDADAADGASDGGSDASTHGDAGAGDIDIDDADIAPLPDGGSGDATPLPAGVHEINIVLAEAEWKKLHVDLDSGYEARGALRLNGSDLGPIEFELHGATAKKFPKKSYRVKLLIDDLDTDLFGDGAEYHQRFVLHAQWVDPTFSRNKLTMDLHRAMGGLAPRVAYARVSVNGHYHGLYTLIERIDEEYLDRMPDMDDDEILYKAYNHNANWKAKSDPLNGFEIAEGKGEPTARLGKLLNACSNTATNAAAFASSVEPILDVPGFMVWQIAHTFAMNQDTYTKNYYLYDDHDAPANTPEALFRVISWDADATFALNWDGTPLPASQASWYGTDGFSPRLLSIPVYRAEYLDRYADALDDELSAKTLNSRLSAMQKQVRPLLDDDYDHWERDIDPDAAWEALRDAAFERNRVMRKTIEPLRNQ